ncbi:hypothetical protein CYY_007030 [Polysphondylium violaceum]|uniref:HIT-type domain-containing protein n=1 Tax=Polysphondylium violaceum TaxID=133409 RepID=A0A8J4UXX1_9MYCE|nr:hypothetical protein CYY_007030 [Polysphondylium violaceum]
MNSLCSICNSNPSKYSCPKCKDIKYCSLDCSNKHKEQVNNHETTATAVVEQKDNQETALSTTTSNATTSTTSKVTEKETSLHYFKKVCDQQLELLDQSKFIQSAITHNKLKELILEIDSKESDAERIQLLTMYRKNIPEFNEFVLQVLATIGTLDNVDIDQEGNLRVK